MHDHANLQNCAPDDGAIRIPGEPESGMKRGPTRLASGSGGERTAVYAAPRHRVGLGGAASAHSREARKKWLVRSGAARRCYYPRAPDSWPDCHVASGNTTVTIIYSRSGATAATLGCATLAVG